MKPDYLICDKCKAKIPESATSFIATDRKLDVSGSLDEVGFVLDLCASCWAGMIVSINNGTMGKMEPYKLGLIIEQWLKNRNLK